ncbi:hypothetical protein [Pseudobacteriovorax antillogorgiicola]|uniref:Uncharacterized protein n=1 Tax=Pseudobacteriovorax antillogorgiicola TaxID=1513793 RepID=A0A1Y6CII2_9BACT|nr:hypothetical protein [Pseudobacteriovorax antillogorgiicola]TCS46977.1 hypothetical protein EDD56_12272 [Pseudobacteriovorax antillogorgiicola]SMF64704.1 hypothetical protein SAMN06296036_12272 [Pseudobacteriovorax antillogorgiicola]
MMFAYFKNVLSDLAKKSLASDLDRSQAFRPKSKISIRTQVQPHYSPGQRSIVVEFSLLNSSGVHPNSFSRSPVAIEIHDGSVKRIHEATWIDHKIALERACSDSCNSSHGDRRRSMPPSKSAKSSQTALRLVSTAQS